MPRSIARTAPMALLLTLLMLLAACGGGGDGDAKASSATQSSTVSPGGVIGTAKLTQQCINYAAYASTIGLAMAAAMQPDAAGQLEELQSKVKLDEAPAELRDDFKVMVDYAQGLGAVLARYDLKAGQYDPAAITAIGEFSKGIDANRMTEAGNNIQAWMNKNCPS